MGYVSLSRAPGRRIEARLLGRRAADEDLCRVLHLVGLLRREADFVASKLSHPSGADRWRYLRRRGRSYFSDVCRCVLDARAFS